MNARMRVADEPPATHSQLIRAAATRGAGAMSAARTARSQINANLMVEATTAIVSDVESLELEIQRLNQRAGGKRPR